MTADSQAKKKTITSGQWKVSFSDHQVSLYNKERLLWTRHGDYFRNNPILLPDDGSVLLFPSRTFGPAIIRESSLGKQLWKVDTKGIYQRAWSTSYFVFSSHFGTSWQWKPGPEGITIRNFMRKYWKVSILSLESGKLTFGSDLINVGEPLTFVTRNWMLSIRLSNPDRYYGWGDIARYDVDLHEAPSGRRLRSWQLPILYHPSDKPYRVVSPEELPQLLKHNGGLHQPFADVMSYHTQPLNSHAFRLGMYEHENETLGVLRFSRNFDIAFLRLGKVEVRLSVRPQGRPA